MILLPGLWQEGPDDAVGLRRGTGDLGQTPPHPKRPSNAWAEATLVWNGLALALAPPFQPWLWAGKIV